MREMSSVDAVQRLGARVAVLLREVFPDCRAKRVARAFNVSVPTAERWLAGHAPAVPHLARMAQFWPRRFIAVVFPLDGGGDNGSAAASKGDSLPATWRHHRGAARAGFRFGMIRLLHGLWPFAVVMAGAGELDAWKG